MASPNHTTTHMSSSVSIAVELAITIVLPANPNSRNSEAAMDGHKAWLSAASAIGKRARNTGCMDPTRRLHLEPARPSSAPMQLLLLHTTNR